MGCAAAYSATLRSTLVAALTCATLCTGTQARADMIDTFNATGTFQGGQSLGGTLTVDTTTGAISSADLTVSGQPDFYYVDNQYGISSSTQFVQFTSPANETVPGLQLPSLGLLLPSSLVSYGGGSILPQATGTTPGLNIPIQYSSSASTLTQPGPGSLVSGALILGVPVTPQVVYIDLLVDRLAVYAYAAGGQAPVQFVKPDSGFYTDASAITSSLNQIYSAYNVQFGSTKPSSGQFDTIYVGGTPDIDLPPNIAAAPDAANAQGVAANINIGNKILDDTAVVFSANPFFNQSTTSTNELRLEQVIAHETGHLLGLVHVLDPSQLLYPDAGNSPEAIGGTAQVAFTNQPNPAPDDPNALFENSSAILGCNVGLVSGVKDCSTVMSQGVFGGVELDSIYLSTFSIVSPIYDASLELIPATPDPDVGATVDYLGTIFPNLSESIDVPFVNGDLLEIVGSLTEGGPTEEFMVNSESGNQFIISQEINVTEPSSCSLLFPGILALLWMIKVNQGKAL